jgi:hypothetical protein
VIGSSPYAPDLFSHEYVCSEIDLLAWYPRESHTRTQARHHFWRSTNDATWDVAWTSIRVTARYLRLDPQWPENEGHYVQCARDDPGATAVWRCETLGRDGKPMPETNLRGKIQ